MKKIILIYLFSTSLFAGCVRIDESMGLFFPKELKELQYVQTQFSAFWWNFIVIDPIKSGEADFESAHKICEKLKVHLGEEIRMVFCGAQDLAHMKILKSWTQDYVLRTEFSKEFESKNKSLLQSTLIHISFVSDPQLFKLMQFDPYQSWNDLMTLSQNSFVSAYARKNGFLFDEATRRIILPLQFLTAPRMDSVQPIINELSDFPQAMLIGSHGSTFRNEKQVKEDLSAVSWMGGVVFVVFILFLVLKSRINTIYLIFPVGISLYAAALVTQWLDGSIHGLTLAFGSGIVGLALDYGLHGAFGSESKQTWKSNLIGLLTTLCGVGILLLSGIPLIRQMMIFSIVGLLLGFSIFYILFRYWSAHLKIKNINFILPQFKFSYVLIIMIFIFGLFGISKTQMSMDLRKLSFVSQKESELMTWLFGKKQQEPYLLMRSFEKGIENYNSEYEWSIKNNIEYDGLGKYLPNVDKQKINLSSWKSKGCEAFQNLSIALQKLFKPYFAPFCLVEKSFIEVSETKEVLRKKEYLSHLIGEQHVLAIFNAKSAEEGKLIKKNYPESVSLVQALKNFSVSLENDLKWMIPITLLLTIFILSFYYRSGLAVLTSLLPFLTGLGLYFSIATFFSLEVDLVSILGLVMVFGFSIDYGVFSTDVHLFSYNNETELKSVYSALTFAAVTNILGFLPMLFAEHPVLLKLGSALFYGTVGTYLGTVYGVYPIYMKRKISNEK